MNADPEEEDDAVRRQREMEELMRRQEEEEDDDPDLAAAQALAAEQEAEEEANRVAGAFAAGLENNSEPSHTKLSYRQVSFYLAISLIVYAFRTRQQYYLAAVFLSSSKWAYVVLGNSFLAFLVVAFDAVCSLFLQGLRLQEAESLQDFFRWNVTETCLALTMFRAELQVSTALEFGILIWLKCLHQVAILREHHVRMTQDAVVERPNSYYWLPKIQGGRLLCFLAFLQAMDLWAVQRSVTDLLKNGPSVQILFAFEAAILLVSAWSHLLLWHLHLMDGGLHYVSNANDFVKRHLWQVWRDNKATLVFAVELQSQAVQFAFYLAFFSIVLTFYGMPLNLFRELYISFALLKERLAAFWKYRQLMASMNAFDSPESEEALEEAGRVCIICRDDMVLGDCKCLPVCKHTFHKACLREWLVQQQSCPTCRSDIASMQAQEAAAAAAANRNEQDDAQEGDDQQEVEVSTVPTERYSPQQRQESSPNEATTRREKTARSKGNDEKPSFIMLYRVIVAHAPVWKEAINNGSGNTGSKPLRYVAGGTIVLGYEHCNKLLRTPGGWVPDSAVECVYYQKQ